MPPTNKPNRKSRSITLPESLDNALQREADQRVVNPSLLVEKAVAAYLPTLPPLDGVATGS